MEINDFLPQYPEADDPKLQDKIAHLHEYADIKLEPAEIAQGQGILMKTQKLMARFINDHTPYNVMLFDYGPGAGKTCGASAIVENYKNTLFNNQPKKKAVIFVKGNILETGFTEEIARVCTKDTYLPSYYQKVKKYDDDIVMKDTVKVSVTKKIGRKTVVFEEEREKITDKMFKGRFTAAVHKTYEFERFEAWTNKVVEPELLSSTFNREIVAKHKDYITILYGKYEKNKNYHEDYVIKIEQLNKELKNARANEKDTSKLIERRNELKPLQKLSIELYTRLLKFVIKRDYSNRLIIIDEVQRFRDTKKTQDKGLDIYDTFWYLTHYAENSKIVLMTGTPAGDQPHNFADVMNLILPMGKEQLPKLSEFQSTFFDKNDKLKNEHLLIEAIRGRVSYARSTVADATKLIDGRVNPWEDGDFDNWNKATQSKAKETDRPWLKHIKIVPLIMDKYQESVYKKALSKDEEKMKKINVDDYVDEDEEDEDDREKPDKKDKRTVAHQNALDASIMVWPASHKITRNWGTVATNFYINNKKREKKKLEFGDPSTGGRRVVRTWNDPAVRNTVTENLKKYSIKFDWIINKFKEFSKEKFFVYDTVLENTLAVLAEIMKINKYGEIYDSSQINIKNQANDDSQDYKRFVILSNTSVSSEGQISELISIFNSPENKNGKFIRIILGTPKVSVGLTFKGIRHYVSLKGSWNRPSQEQAEARGFRLGSLNFLEPEDRIYTIHRLSAAEGHLDENNQQDGYCLPKDTVDILVYKTAEKKDLQWRQINRLIKIHSIDCPITYARNVQKNDKKGNEECDYLECNYECANMKPTGQENGVNQYNVPEDQISYTNYNLFYSQHEQQIIMDKFSRIFIEKSQYTLDEILDFPSFEKHNTNLILMVLDNLIGQQRNIFDRYGFPIYVKEQSNIYFVDRSLVSKPMYTNSDYVDQILVNKEIDLDTLISSIVGDDDENKLIDIFCDTKKDEDILNSVKKFNNKILADLIELVTTTYSDSKRYQICKRYVSQFIYKMSDDNLVHTMEGYEYCGTSHNACRQKLLITEKMRYLIPGGDEWFYCTKKSEGIYNKEIKILRKEQATKIFLDDPQIKYYAKYTAIDGKNRIFMRPDVNKKCYAQGQLKIINVIMKYKLVLPEYIDYPTDQAEIIKQIKSTGIVLNSNQYDLNKLSTRVLASVLFIISNSVEKACKSFISVFSDYWHNINNAKKELEKNKKSFNSIKTINDAFKIILRINVIETNMPRKNVEEVLKLHKDFDFDPYELVHEKQSEIARFIIIWTTENKQKACNELLTKINQQLPDLTSYSTKFGINVENSIINGLQSINIKDFVEIALYTKLYLKPSIISLQKRSSKDIIEEILQSTRSKNLFTSEEEGKKFLKTLNKQELETIDEALSKGQNNEKRHSLVVEHFKNIGLFFTNEDE